MKRLRAWFNAGSTDQAKAADVSVPERVDLLAPDFIHDPYPTYAWLRAQRPLAELEAGGYLLVRHDDVSEAVENPKLGNAPSRFSPLAAKNKERHVAAAIAAHIAPFQDGTEHASTRKPLARAVVTAVRSHAPDFDALARLHVAQAPAGPIDVLGAILTPFACASAARIVGIDAPTAQIKTITSAFFHLFAPLRGTAHFEQVNADLGEARELMRDARDPKNTTSLLAQLTEARIDGAPLSELQIIDLAILILADAVENIEAGAALTLRQLRSDPRPPEVAMDAIVREALRLETPAQILPRVVLAEVEILGKLLRPGTPVFLGLGSANRDSAVIDDADRFDPTASRQARTFGFGAHRCLGEGLALAQISAIVSALMDRGITPNGDWKDLRFRARLGHRWPVNLPSVLP